jgi:hypothetical protein
MKAKLIVTTEVYTMPILEFNLLELNSKKELLKELKMWISNLDSTPLHNIEIEFSN